MKRYYACVSLVRACRVAPSSACGAGKLKPGSQKPLYASGDAPGLLTVCDARQHAAMKTTVNSTTASGKQLLESAANGMKPVRISDLRTGLEASTTSPCETGCWSATDVRLRWRVQAPLGSIVPPVATHSGRQKLRPHKHRKAVNYTMYNDQRFAEAEQRKKDAAAKKAKARADAQAALTEQMDSGVAFEPTPRQSVGIGQW